MMTPPSWMHEDDVPFPVAWLFRGVVRRIVASVLLPVAWLSLTLLYLGFWAHGLTWVQDLIVGVVSVLTLFAALAVLWVTFGVQAYRHWVDA
jgi:hypothetical protein